MITVRKAEIKDLELLAPLFDAYRQFYRKSTDLEGAKNFLAARINNSESVIYLAKSENKVVGFTQLYPMFTSTNMKRSWILNDLYVDQNFRGQGISKLLIDNAKQLCRDTQAYGIMLETERSNDIGNQLYPRTGFTLETNNFYSWINNES